LQIVDNSDLRTYKSINLVNLESEGGNAPMNPLDDRMLNKHVLIYSC